jgi:hypothetical protein
MEPMFKGPPEHQAEAKAIRLVCWRFIEEEEREQGIEGVGHLARLRNCFTLTTF